MTEPAVTVFVKDNTQTYLAGRIKPDFNFVGDVVLAISTRPVFQGCALYLTRMTDDEQLGENVALSMLPRQAGPTGLEVTLRVHTGPAAGAARPFAAGSESGAAGGSGARDNRGLGLTLADLAAKQAQQDAELALLKAQQAAAAERAEKDRLARLIIKPGPASKHARSRASARSVEEAARLDLKARTLRYYGLLVDDSSANKEDWTAHTMLDGPGTPPLPLSACTLAHLWPEEQEHLASEIADELRLPDGFYAEPRNYLILPKDAHDGFDNQALLFLPARNGKISVRKWRVEDRSPAEEAGLAKYFGKELVWPNREAASPELPFMRLLAFRMMSASKKRPVTEPASSLGCLSGRPQHFHHMAEASGNEAVRSLCDRLSLL